MPRLHFDTVNAKGGVNGRTIEIKRLDDGYEPERCAANTRQLIADDVFALFGYIGTPTSLAALPLASTAKVPFFAPFTGAQALREPFNRYAIHVRASYFRRDGRHRAPDHLHRHQEDRGFLPGRCLRQDRAGRRHPGHDRDGTLRPSALGTVERNTIEVAQAVKDIMAQKPEAIVQIGAYKSVATFVRQARRAGFNGNFYNVSFVGTQALIDELGAEARGVSVSQVMPFPYTPATLLSGEYLAAIKDKRGVEPNYSGMEGFVAAKVFTEGLRRAGQGAHARGLHQRGAGHAERQLRRLPGGFGAPRNTLGSKFCGAHAAHRRRPHSPLSLLHGRARCTLASLVVGEWGVFVRKQLRTRVALQDGGSCICLDDIACEIGMLSDVCFQRMNAFEVIRLIATRQGGPIGLGFEPRSHAVAGVHPPQRVLPDCLGKALRGSLFESVDERFIPSLRRLPHAVVRFAHLVALAVVGQFLASTCVGPGTRSIQRRAGGIRWQAHPARL